MSKTVPVGFRTRNLWIYDQSLSVWLVRFLAYVEKMPPQDARRLSPFVGRARGAAVAGARYMLSFDWIVDREVLDTFVAAATQVSRRIRAEREIEVRLLRRIRIDHEPIILRDDTWALDPEPVASVGDALASLVRGSLPHPPEGTWWYVGVEPTYLTIRMAGAPADSHSTWRTPRLARMVASSFSGWRRCHRFKGRNAGRGARRDQPSGRATPIGRRARHRRDAPRTWTICTAFGSSMGSGASSSVRVRRSKGHPRRWHSVERS